MANYWDRIWYILHPNNHVMKICLGSGTNCKSCKSLTPECFYKEGHIILGLHLVLVTLHKWFTINIEHGKQNRWH